MNNEEHKQILKGVRPCADVRLTAGRVIGEIMDKTFAGRLFVQIREITQDGFGATTWYHPDEVRSIRWISEDDARALCPPGTATIEMIEKTVCFQFGVQPAFLHQKGRPINMTMPRQIIAYLARKYLKLHYKSIGQFFGQDHGTAMNGVERVTGWLASEDALVTRIVRACEGELWAKPQTEKQGTEKSEPKT